jgi:site-specific recombinase
VLQKILSKRYLIRFSKYIEHNLGSLVGNVCLGFFLGMAGFIGFIFGIPFDIRHITISSGNYAIAIVTLVKEIHWSYALICLVGVIGIGVFNFLISFSLALFVAIRSRNVKYKELKKLLYFTSTYFRKYPADFFFSPKQERKESDL